MAGSLIVVSIAIYLLYGRRRHTGEYALLHLVERITNRAITGDHLERELQMIVHDKEEIRRDEVDSVLSNAATLDISDGADLETAFNEIADHLANTLASSGNQSGDPAPDSRSIKRFLQEREAQSSTAISEFVAVPHLVLPGEDQFTLVCARSREGIAFDDRHQSIRAVFVLAGSRDCRTLHLKTLAALAQIAMNHDFETEWISARKPERLREVLLLAERRRTGREDRNEE